MRLHGVHAFDAFPLVVRSGGMLQAFGARAGRKVVDPQTGDTTIVCQGFNRKNHYDRQSPCDPDFLRKLAKDTDAHEDGPGISRCKEKYGIDVLIQIRRNMDIYTDALALFQDPAVKWVDCLAEHPAKSAAARKLPRALAKREKKRQQTLQQLKHQQTPAASEKILIKKQAAAIGEFRSWSSFTVPLSVVANREWYADGHQESWFLIDTQTVIRPEKTQQDYQLRVAIEERYRQLKCFSDLTRFTSRAFSWWSIKWSLSCSPTTCFRSISCIGAVRS
jgi:hypothetical protein